MPRRPRHPALASQGRWLWTLLLWLVAFAYAVPLLWMVIVSLKSPADAAAPGAGIWPRTQQSATDGTPIGEPALASPAEVASQAAANYQGVWNSPLADFPLQLHNSLWVALLSSLGMVASSAVVAYGFSRLRWPGRDAVFLVVLVTLMIPQAVVMAPLYVVFRELGWIGTLLPLWLPSWTGGAFAIFLLRQFFLTIPRELDEAARLDGCSHLGVLCRVIVPLSGPALGAVAVLHFAAVWNDFLGPLLFLNHQDQYTLGLGLHMFNSQHGGTPWNLVMAFSTMVVIPVLIVYAFARRLFLDVGSGTPGPDGRVNGGVATGLNE